MRASIALAVFSLLALSGIIYLIWMNRASEKIITGVPIAVGALLAIIVSVLFFGGEPPFIATFPVSFVYKSETRAPWDPPLSMLRSHDNRSLFAVGRLLKARPELAKAEGDRNGGVLYHHLLQKAIIDWLGLHYSKAWQAEILNFDLPSGGHGLFGPAPGAAEPSEVLSTKKLEELLQGNMFAAVHTGMPTEITVPAGTALSITLPDHQLGLPGGILLRNKFCKLLVQTSMVSWTRGAGQYATLALISQDEDAKLGTATYVVRVRAEFSRWLNGHPKMPAHRAWAKQIVQGLKLEFDEEVNWKRVKEEFIFREVKKLSRARP